MQCQASIASGKFFDAFYSDLNRLVDGLKDVPLCMQDSLLPSSRWKGGITDMTWQLSLIATTPKDEKWWELSVHTSYCKREGHTHLGDSHRCRHDWSIEIIEIYIKGQTRWNPVTFETRWSEHGHAATWHRRSHQASQLLVVLDVVLKWCITWFSFPRRLEAIAEACGEKKKEDCMAILNSLIFMTLRCRHQIASTCVQTPVRINRRTNFCDWSREFGLLRFGGDVVDGTSLPSIQVVWRDHTFILYILYIYTVFSLIRLDLSGKRVTRTYPQLHSLLFCSKKIWKKACVCF